MMKWVIWSSMGFLYNYGEFDTKEECEVKCKELRKLNEHVNVFYTPFSIENFNQHSEHVETKY